jgi:hypothetical protein
MMSNSPGGFDPVGVVVDWIDACRERNLPALLDLYDDSAIVDCCEGGRFRGRTEVEQYWQPKLFSSVPGAFEIDVLMPEVEGVLLDYRSYDGRAVQDHCTAFEALQAAMKRTKSQQSPLPN